MTNQTYLDEVTFIDPTTGKVRKTTVWVEVLPPGKCKGGDLQFLTRSNRSHHTKQKMFQGNYRSTYKHY